MSRRLKPRMIIGIDQFEDDLTSMHRKLLEHARSIRTSSPHYWPIMDLAGKLAETMTTVTGREAPWVRNYASPFSASPPTDELSNLEKRGEKG